MASPQSGDVRPPVIGGQGSGNEGQRPEAPRPDTTGPENSTRDAASSHERHEAISRAAYRRAEERGFEPGQELDDWLAAERDIDGSARH